MSNPKDNLPNISAQAEGGMEAPVIYFESAPTYAVSAGVGQIVMEMFITEPDASNSIPRTRRRIVAHLRGPLVAFDSLRRVINEMEAMITPNKNEKSH
jgi:hypothetical protein